MPAAVAVVNPSQPRMISRCAWCAPQPVPVGVVISHGICARHAMEVEAEYFRAGPVSALRSECSEIGS